MRKKQLTLFPTTSPENSKKSWKEGLTGNTHYTMPELSLMDGKPKLKITEEVLLQIKQLCHRIWHVEWSGVLFYEIVSGDIDDPDNMIIETRFIYPMDKGSAAETGFKYWEDVLDVYQWDSKYEDMQMALIHSHHNMSTFFSSTDQRELLNNACNFNLYLSLIVNNALQPTCWIAQQVDIEREYVDTKSYLNKSGKIFTSKVQRGKEPKKEVIYWEVDIEMPEQSFDIPEIFSKRLEEVVKPKPVVRSPKPYKRNNSVFDFDLKDWDAVSKIEAPTKEKVMQEFLPRWVEGDDSVKGDVLGAIANVSNYVNVESKRYDKKQTMDLLADDLVTNLNIFWEDVFGYAKPSHRDLDLVQGCLNTLYSTVPKKYFEILDLLTEVIETEYE